MTLKEISTPGTVFSLLRADLKLRARDWSLDSFVIPYDLIAKKLKVYSHGLTIYREEQYIEFDCVKDHKNPWQIRVKDLIEQGVITFNNTYELWI